MKDVIAAIIALFAVLTATAARTSDSGRIAVVAAENFYGGIAHQIGGERVSVTSILSNPDQDPHLFEVSAAVVREIAAAQIVIYNGADYDPWMERLLTVTPKPGRVAINVAALMHTKPGNNPHLWYDPATMPAVAKALAAALTAADPSYQQGYTARLHAFLASLEPVNDEIAAIAGKYAGVPVTATEPVFGDMAAALKLKMRNQRFQLAVMNNTEPSASDIAAFERDLESRRVRVMFYNKQASDELVRHLVDLARAANIPVVGVTETAPPGRSYLDWILDQLNETARALASPSS